MLKLALVFALAMGSYYPRGGYTSRTYYSGNPRYGSSTTYAPGGMIRSYYYRGMQTNYYFGR